MTRAPGGTWIALLRGLNVGGKNRLAMADLAAAFEAAGAEAARTFIQSGNVLFEAPAARAPGVAEAARRTLASRHGLEVPVVLRSAAELSAVVEGNPFLGPGVDPDLLHVAFLAQRPPAAAAAALDPLRSPPDRLELRGRDLFLHLPNGVARTRITNAWLDRTLGTTSTVRNWRTVLALLELATGPARPPARRSPPGPAPRRRAARR
jgi:uncharacterized protein (DUF1697 family)